MSKKPVDTRWMAFWFGLYMVLLNAAIVIALFD